MYNFCYESNFILLAHSLTNISFISRFCPQTKMSSRFVPPPPPGSNGPPIPTRKIPPDPDYEVIEFAQQYSNTAQIESKRRDKGCYYHLRSYEKL